MKKFQVRFPFALIVAIGISLVHPIVALAQAPNYCGDGMVQTGETCDDSNQVNGDNCSSTCQIESCLWDISGQTMIEYESSACSYYDDWVGNYINSLPNRHIRKNFINQFPPGTYLTVGNIYNATALDNWGTDTNLLKGAIVFQASAYISGLPLNNINTQVPMTQAVIDKYIIAGKDLVIISDGSNFREAYFSNGRGYPNKQGQNIFQPQSPMNKTFAIFNQGNIGGLPQEVEGPAANPPPLLSATANTPPEFLPLNGQTFGNSTWGYMLVNPLHATLPNVVSSKCIFDQIYAGTHYCTMAEYIMTSGSRVLISSGYSMASTGVTGPPPASPGFCTPIDATGTYPPGTPTARFLDIITAGLCGPKAVCGDGVLDTSPGTKEACDDGNIIDGDGCSHLCQTGALATATPTATPTSIATATPVPAICNDGIDNDNDGKADCIPGQEDPGCYPDGQGDGGACNPNDNNEANTISPCTGQCNSAYLDGGDQFCGDNGNVCIANSCMASMCTISGMNCDLNKCLAICPSVQMSTPTPLFQQSVHFTCTQVPGVNHYIFRVITPQTGTTSLLNGITPGSNISTDITLSEIGDYQVQCQLCSGATNDTCGAFENAIGP